MKSEHPGPTSFTDISPQPTVLQWIAALRSGEYPQSRKALCSTGGFCCLGVYADMTEGQEWHEELSGYSPPGVLRSVFPIEKSMPHWEPYVSNTDLPQHVQQRLNAMLEVQHVDDDDVRMTGCLALMGLNDTGSSFSEIADLIEAAYNDYLSEQE